MDSDSMIAQGNGGRKVSRPRVVVIGKWIGYSLAAFVMMVWLRLLWDLSGWVVGAAKGIMP